ncbi:PH domain-containing protein [Halomicrococcus gelatinilyticus]|uniref:PH domain-containing protein n=1 Tax=Halomicrococcus gelatinilyticus TaxID=1702103 RepID=UPI002E13C73E
MKLHPLSLPYRAVTRGVSVASTLLFAGLALGGAVDFLDPVRIVALAAAGLLVAAAYESAYYRRFGYELTENSLDIESGVLSRRRREIPLRRVQNVDIRRNVVQRAAGIAAVSLETAGGGETEASLRFVSYEEAKRLQSDIRRRKRRAAAEEPAAGAETAEATASGVERPASGVEAGERIPPGAAEPEEEELYAIQSSELVLLSAISVEPRVAGLAVFVVPLLTRGGTGVDALFGLAQLAFSGLVLWVASAMVTFARYYDFRLTRVGDELRYERGLLQRYDGTVPLEKVQTVTLKENPLMRAAGYASLAIETAGYAPGQGGDGSEAAIPIATRGRVLSLAREVESFETLDFRRPPKRARRRYAVRFALVAGGLTAGAYALHRYTDAFDLWFAVAALVVLAPVAAHYRWKHRGYSVGADHVVTRNGFWRRSTVVVPYYRVQTVVQQATVFQRRLWLATVVVDTASSARLAGRDARAADFDAATAAELRELVAERLQTDLRERRAAEKAGE